MAHQDEDVEDVAAFGDKLHLRVKENTAKNVIARLPKVIESQNAKLTEIRQIPPALEDVFIALSEDRNFCLTQYSDSERICYD